ncbi:proteoglycan 4-like, partial [Lates japonicus]
MMIMRMVMMKMSLWFLLLDLSVNSAAAGPGSCVDRCGEVFTRGRQCTCDFSCLQHHECCQDFMATCTTAQSCQGRCGEPFRRGQLCECDPQCTRHNTCCHDYQLHCDAGVSLSQPGTLQPLRAAAPVSSSGNGKSQKSRKRSNSESEEWFKGVSTISGGLQPVSIPSSHSGAPDSPTPLSALPSYSALSQGSRALASPSGLGAVGGEVNGHPMQSPGGAHGSSQGLTGSRPSTLQDVAQALGLSVVDVVPEEPGAGLFADADLCSDSPISGLTALSNGTMLIFKGELFWSVDPVSRSVGHPQRITDTLGVSAPIDTVFTRCNCNSNTYIIKGDQYWSLDENMAVEPGFPRPLTSEFPGLTGPIRAALAVPATRTRPETVYFFKNGDIMQSFTFPSCNTKPRSPLKRRSPHQAVLQSGDINIRVSLKGFPTPVSSALSMLSPHSSDRFYHYIFSGPLYFRVQIIGDLPALAKPDPSSAHAPLPIFSPAAMATNSANMATQNPNPTYPVNSITVWLRCP